MLILARKAGDAVVLDGGIRLSILSTDGRTVRIGIEAPPEVRILRAEIVDSVESETRRASTAAQPWLAANAPSALSPLRPRMTPLGGTSPVTEG
ncbi:MAG: carbon storage regulator [Gemmatimonadaceae bacterium]